MTFLRHLIWPLAAILFCVCMGLCLEAEAWGQTVPASGMAQPIVVKCYTNGCFDAATVREVSLTPWKASLATLAAAHSLDIASSLGKREGNPLLNQASSRFSWQGAVAVAGAVGAVVVVEWLVVRRHPEVARKFAIVNFINAGAVAGIAAHNFTVKQ